MVITLMHEWSFWSDGASCHSPRIMQEAIIFVGNNFNWTNLMIRIVCPIYKREATDI